MIALLCGDMCLSCSADVLVCDFRPDAVLLGRVRVKRRTPSKLSATGTLPSLASLWSDSRRSSTVVMLLSVPLTEEPDKFDKDFNDSESEEDDNDLEETALRKKERAVKVRNKDHVKRCSSRSLSNTC